MIFLQWYLTFSQAITAGLMLVCIALWATSYVPEYWPALLFFAIACAAQLAPAEVVLSGFTSSTFWLLFSGMIFGQSIKHTQLNERTARLLMLMMGRSYPSIIIRIGFFSLALAFLIPSSLGRVVLLLPIVSSLAIHLGYEKNSNGRNGMMFIAAFGTFLPAFSILPANAPNMILSGMSESLFGLTLSYWQYLLLHFPVLGLLKLLVLMAVIIKLLPADGPQQGVVKVPPKQTWRRQEVALLLLLGACLILWLTDTLHHISPGWIALTASVILLVPFLGMTSKDSLDKLQYGTLFFVAGIIGLGAVVSHNGLGSVLVDQLTQRIEFAADGSTTNLALLTLISIILGIATNLPGIPAVMSPLAEHLSVLTGLPLNTVLMTQVVAFSSVILPYQAPPLMAALAVGQLSIKTMAKISLTMFFITLLILIPLDFAWWHWLGMNSL